MRACALQMLNLLLSVQATGALLPDLFGLYQCMFAFISVPHMIRQILFSSFSGLSFWNSAQAVYILGIQIQL